MEDIKILEGFIKYFEAEAMSRKYRRNISITVGEDDIEVIENLIARNKKLESALDNSISKDKIKAKIAELDEEINSKEAPIYAYPLIVERDALQELLNKGE